MGGGDKRGGEWLCVTVCALRVSQCRFLLALGGDEREFVVLHLRGSSGDVPEPVGWCVVLCVWVGNCLPGTSERTGVLGLESWAGNGVCGTFWCVCASASAFHTASR